MTALRLGTRGSQLAVTQSSWVGDLVRESSAREVELVRITTTGDTTTGSLAAMGGTGVFATALRESLLSGECDFIVHSLKDLPTAEFPGLTIAAIPLRERANDALCSTSGLTLARLPAGARVGTGSPRRAAQVRNARPDLLVADIRGNVDSRLAKVASGEFDAAILASAGLRRLGRVEDIAEEFELDAWPTSAGQGALAVECRTGDADAELRGLLGTLSDVDTLVCSELEREVLRQLEAGCSAPIGISARFTAGGLSLVTEVYAEQPHDSLRVLRNLDRAAAAEHLDRVRVAASVVAELNDRGLGRVAAVGADRG